MSTLYPRAVGWEITALLAGTIGFSLIVAIHAHFVPIWDSWIYATCVTEAAAHPWKLERFGCAEHFSHAYALLLAVPSMLGARGMGGMLGVNMLLGVVAILSVHSIARSLVPSNEHRIDCGMTSLMFALHPIFSASAVFINIDYGVLAFGLWTLACFVQHRRYTAIVAGCLLVFSKEVGSMVYFVIFCGYCWLRWTSQGRTSHALALTARHVLPLLTPLVMVLLYLVCIRPKSMHLWGNATPMRILADVAMLAPHTDRTAAQLAAIFVVNYMWFPSILLGGGLAWWLLARRLPGSSFARAAVHPGKARYLFGVVVLTAFLLTRNHASVSVRYYAITAPLLLLATLVAAISLPITALARRALFGLMSVAFAASSFRTCDPVSRQVYGTFRFGSHRMLTMNSINKECCGYGLDQLVYNLEFVRFHEVLDSTLMAVRPTVTRPIVVADAADWFLLARMDFRTYRRTLSADNSRRVPHLDLTELARRRMPPSELVFLALPNADNLPALMHLKSQFDVIETLTVGKHGYVCTGTRMRRRGAAISDLNSTHSGISESERYRNHTAEVPSIVPSSAANLSHQPARP